MIADNIRGSIIKLAQSLILDINSQNTLAFEFIDWDAHANMQEIPEFDLIGTAALGWTANDTFCEISFALGVSTLNDTNLFRSWTAIGHIFERLKPAATIPFYDASTQLPISYMTVLDGTTVSPMSRAEIRPFQFVQANLILESSLNG